LLEVFERFSSVVDGPCRWPDISRSLLPISRAGPAQYPRLIDAKPFHRRVEIGFQRGGGAVMRGISQQSLEPQVRGLVHESALVGALEKFDHALLFQRDLAAWPRLKQFLLISGWSENRPSSIVSSAALLLLAANRLALRQALSLMRSVPGMMP